MARIDPHSYFDTDHPAVSAIDLGLCITPSQRVVCSRVRYTLHGAGGGVLDFDTMNLHIDSVQHADGEALQFTLADPDPVLGRRLRVHVPAGCKTIVIQSTSAPDQRALYWLEDVPHRTGPGRFVFSMTQDRGARALYPIQDTPAVRLPVRVQMTVPVPLVALASGRLVSTEPGPQPGTRTFTFESRRPLPAHLVAWAAGELASSEIGPRSRVWAEPHWIARAEWEFRHIERSLQAAESVFGPYEWERYDMMVVPPDIPNGAFEYPNLTYASSALLEGDGSLEHMILHDMAHAWTTNCVSFASGDDYPLSAGWTLWTARRILEVLRGQNAAGLEWRIGACQFRDQPRPMTAGADPTHRQSSDVTPRHEHFDPIAIERGAWLFAKFEAAAGRQRFDAFIREFRAAHAGHAASTASFIDCVEHAFPGIVERCGARDWWDGSAPSAAELPVRSPAVPEIEVAAHEFAAGIRPSTVRLQALSRRQLQLFLLLLPRPLDHESCAWLDRQCRLTEGNHFETLARWLPLAAAADYAPAFDRIREFLQHVGWKSFVPALYESLDATPRTRALAREAYARAHATYHLRTRRMVEQVMAHYTS